jgi:rubrerythrin
MAVEIEEWAVVLMNNALNVAEPYRMLIPTDQGESMDKQIYPWDMDGIKHRMQKQFEPHEAAPETISNIINMMAVELQHWHDYSTMATMTSDKKFKSLLSDLARAEQVHHLKLMSLLPTPHAPSEMALEGEVAILSAYGLCMSREPDDSIRDAYMHMFMDHQTHAEYASGVVQKAGCPVDAITGGADLSGGRPLNEQFMRPGDTMWKGSLTGSYDRNNVHPLTLINVDMALAGELTAWNVYHCAMAGETDATNKQHFAGFQAVESQHVGILGSIKNPSETPLERSLVHEAVEISSYAMMRDMEPDENVKKVFHDLFREDLEQGYLLGQFAR